MWWRLISSVGRAMYDLPTNTCTWQHPTTGQHGSAEVVVPRDHAAFPYLEVGMWAMLVDDALGVWPGRVTQPPRWGDTSATVALHHVSALFDGRRCYSIQELRGVTPGAVVRTAFRAAFGEGAAGRLRLGTVVEAPPVVMSYTLDGQYFGQVLSDMEALSGQTWNVDSNWAFNWVTDSGSLYTPLLVQDADVLMSAEGPVDRAETAVGQVIARGTDGRFVASPAAAPSIADVAWRQDEIRVDTSSLSELLEAADIEVARRAQPAVLFPFQMFAGAPYAGGVSAARTVPGQNRMPRLLTEAAYPSARGHHRAVREGTVIHFTAPRSRKSGDAGLGRVLSRTYHGDTGLLDLSVQLLPPLSSTTLQAAGRGVARLGSPLNPNSLVRRILDAQKANGSVVGDKDIAEVAAAKVNGKVGQAQAADSATTATTAASVPATGVTAGALPAGVTIPGGQVSSAVANANAVPASGVGSGNLGSGVAAPAAALQAGTVPAGVVVPGANVSGAVATATTANGVAAGAVGNAGLTATAVDETKTAFNATTTPTVNAGTATAVPATPVTWIPVKDAGGTTRYVPAYS